VASRRATRDFGFGGDPWPTVEDWAGRQGYGLLEQSGDRRLYKKGAGIMAGSRLLELQRSGEQVHLEAWVAANGLARLFSLFILPSEITIESGGAKGALPRKLGRGEVNDLLEALGQPPIE
jgi:hypothetical protein